MSRAASSWLIRSAQVALLLTACGGAAPAADPPATPEDLYWTSDAALAARIDSLGHEQVRSEVRAMLGDIITACSQPPRRFNYPDIEAWATGLRWTAILADRQSLPLIDRIAALEPSAGLQDVHHRLTYLARWTAYRIRSRDQSLAQRVATLAEGLFAGEEGGSAFAADRLRDLGSPVLPELLQYAREQVIPEMGQLEEAFTEEELEFTYRYLQFTDLLREMLTSEDDRRLLGELRDDPDPHARLFASDVLATD
jgi:hypothetical protein